MVAGAAAEASGSGSPPGAGAAASNAATATAPSLSHVLPYPLFGVEWVRHGMVLVAGGGGASRTGVPNGVAVYRVSGVARLKSSIHPLVPAWGWLGRGLYTERSIVSLLGLSFVCFTLPGSPRLIHHPSTRASLPPSRTPSSAAAPRAPSRTSRSTGSG